LEIEMQPDTEHQENNADLGKLMGHFRIGDETGGLRPKGDARKQISHNRR